MKESKIYAVAIDGPSGAGKSTIARSVARELGFVYVDTGAIYRTLGYAAFSRGMDPQDAEAVTALLKTLSIRMDYDSDGLQRMYLGEEDVTDKIRLPEISMYASRVSAIPAVRAFLLEMQQDMARHHSVIMDGRDIGTVVLPQADVKIYLTAAAEARAQRRLLELQQRGQEAEYETILRDIIQRDDLDEHRPIAPLRRAEDAELLDTTHLNLEQSLEALLRMVKEKIDL